MVPLSVTKLFERPNGVFELYIHSGDTNKLFSDEECLRKEPLDFSSPTNDNLVFLRQFVNSKNCNNVLKVFIALQYLLYLTRDPIMLLSEEVGRNDSAA